MPAVTYAVPRALLLDYGSVISISPFERHRDSERLLGLPTGTLSWLGPLNPATDAAWAAMQREEISERDYWARRAAEVAALAGEAAWDVVTLFERIRPADPNAEVRPEMETLVAQARAAGLRVGVLSNEFELFCGAGMAQRLRVLHGMEAFVDATHTKILKPERRAYELALAALGCDAHEVLFVDDQFRNIAGAVRAGLQTQYFDLRDVPGNLRAIAARLGLDLARGR